MHLDQQALQVLKERRVVLESPESPDRQVLKVPQVNRAFKDHLV